MLAVAIVLALTWAALAVLGWMAYQLFVQNGRLLLRLEALERRQPLGGDGGVSDEEPGLPAGSVLQDFELPDLHGGRMTLSQWRGRRLLIVFVCPTCAYCRQLAPSLSRLDVSPPIDRVLPILISTGDPAANRRFLQEHGIALRVLLQEDGEVASLYQALGTPTAYLVGADGRTEAPLAVGAAAVLALAGLGRPHLPAPHAVAPVANSRLQRDGLRAGATAPPFRLPRLGGGELALEDFRGSRVLLVFSDPQCGPCEALAPHLQRLQETRADVRVLVVSRGALEDNQARATQLGLTYPIVLQRRWEISTTYAMFATPIGYLVDEQGILVSDVARGGEAILRLAESLTSAPRNDQHTTLIPM